METVFCDLLHTHTHTPFSWDETNDDICRVPVIRLYSNTISIDATRHVHCLYFSLCLVEGTHREHVQLVEVDAPDIAHVDGRGSTRNMLDMSTIHNSKSVPGRFLIMTGCVSSYKSAMAS